MGRPPKDSISGDLTDSATQEYNRNEIAGVIAPESGGSQEDSAYLDMKRKLKAGFQPGSLPEFKHNPNWVYAWVGDDARMSGDNLLSRLNFGWELVTSDDQPQLASLLSGQKDLMTASSTTVKGAIRYKELVAVKLSRGAHDAWMEHFHVELPKQKERELLGSIGEGLDRAGSIDGKVQMESGIPKNFTRIKANNVT